MKLALWLPKYPMAPNDPCAWPLGFMYVSAVLKKSGRHEVKVFNCNISDFDMDRDLTGFDAVLCTGFDPFEPEFKKLSDVCKEKGLKFILGGGLATFRPEKALEYADLVIRGECEGNIVDLVELYGIHDGKGRHIDDIPWPDFEGFGIKEHIAKSALPYIGVITSRGCPYNCIFCNQTCKFASRSLNKVFEEIDAYVSMYGVKMVCFYDNTLNLDAKRFDTLCEGLRERKLQWTGGLRADLSSEAQIKKAKECGLRHVIIGVEGMTQKKLDLVNKKETPETINKALGWLEKYNIPYVGNVLFGFPGETMQDIMDELYLMKKSTFNLNPIIVQPFAGTRFENKRDISPEQTEFLNNKFFSFIADKFKSGALKWQVDTYAQG